MVAGTTTLPLLRGRNAVAVVFALNGFGFASWVSRIPEARNALDLSPGELGLLLLAISAGSLLALPSTGMLVHRFGAAKIVAAGAAIDAVGLVVVGFGVAAGFVAFAAVGLFVYGFGVGAWDVAMNVEGAAVEREMGRSVMPRFHAAFSLGTVVGAGVGVTAAAADLSLTTHLLAAALVLVVVTVRVVRLFLPPELEGTSEAVSASNGPRHPMRAWTEPTTLMIGLMVLALALTEGTANDWLAVALVDGYGVEEWVGAAGYTAFVVAMTAGRMAGTMVLDRFGRVPVLWATMAVAAAGVLLVVFGAVVPLVVAGVILWGLGASLGFPVGMSAAADDPRHAAARVSVVSTIGYTAFLAGPPLVGFVGDQVGTLKALLVVSLMLLPSALVVPSARERAVAARR